MSTIQLTAGDYDFTGHFNETVTTDGTTLTIGGNTFTFSGDTYTSADMLKTLQHKDDGTYAFEDMLDSGANGTGNYSVAGGNGGGNEGGASGDPFITPMF